MVIAAPERKIDVVCVPLSFTEMPTRWVSSVTVSRGGSRTSPPVGALVRSSPIPVLLISLDEGVIVAASDAAGALFDASSASASAAGLVGGQLGDLIAPSEATHAALTLV